MFTLKLYRNGPLPPDGRTVVMEVAGIWLDRCDHGVCHLIAFRKTVGVEDEEGSFRCYVGGDKAAWNEAAPPTDRAILLCSDNYFGWGVLENAQGKTTEMLR